jgi:hypothetical protein
MEERGEGSVIRTNFISQVAPLFVAFVGSDPQGYFSISKDTTTDPVRSIFKLPVHVQ